MRFLPTEEQDMLRQSVSATLARGGGVSALADLGVFGILLPEALGGSGLGMTEAAIVLHEAGRAGQGGDLAARILCAEPAARTRHDLAVAIVSGRAAIRFPVSGELLPVGGGLSGRLNVPDPAPGDWVAAPVAGTDDVALFVAADMPRVSRAMIEPDQPACLIAADMPLDKALIATCPGLRDRMALLACAEMLGLADHAFALALAYIKDRHQFGQPVGANQALQHIAADTFLHLENIRVAVEFAAAALDAAGRDPARAAMAMAVLRAQVPQTAREIVETAIHLHGGIGLTWDYGLNAPLRRILRLGMATGAGVAHRQALCDMVLSERGRG